MLVGNAIGIPFSKVLRRGIPQNGLVAQYAPAHKRNLLRWSEDFNNGVWSKNRVVIESNVVSPIGTLTGCKIIKNDITTPNQITQVVNFFATELTLCYSVFGKAGENNLLHINFFDGVTSKTTFFNLITGEISGGIGVQNLKMTYVGDGWWRCSGSIVASTSGVTFVLGVPSGCSVGEGHYIWGAQLELGSEPTPYQFNQDNQTLWNEKRTALNVTNVVQNGNFANGTSGWLATSSTHLVNNNICVNTGNGATMYPGEEQNTSISCITGKKLYVKARGRVTNGSASSLQILIAGTTGGGNLTVKMLSNPIQNIWYDLSGIVTFGETNTGYVRFKMLHVYSDAATANGKVMEVQEVMAIDLTALFGAGNEPTAVQCDRMFANWFDGTVNMSLPIHHAITPYMATNLIQNGNFANGTTGWDAFASCSLSSGLNALVVTSTAATTCVYGQDTSVPCVAGKQVYVKGRLKVTSAGFTVIDIVVRGSTSSTTDTRLIFSQNNPVLNQQYSFSGIGTLTANHTGNVRIAGRITVDAIGRTMEVQDVFTIDLTALFGAGNEPTKEQCDQIFANWFDGTQQVNRIRSIGQGTLGSTTGADVNDPTWTGNSLLFATDDYVQMPVPFNVNGDWTVYVVAKRDGMPSANEYFWALASSSLSIPNVALLKTTAGNIQCWVRTDVSDSVTLNFPIANGFSLFCVKKTGTQFVLKNLTSNVSASNTLSGVFSINRCTLGALIRSSAVNYLNGEIAYYMPYGRATTDAEDLRIYKGLKKQLAQRGIAI